jgi:hypothetical protein
MLLAADQGVLAVGAVLSIGSGLAAGAGKAVVPAGFAVLGPSTRLEVPAAEGPDPFFAGFSSTWRSVNSWKNRSARRENGGAENPLVDESEVIEALGALDPVWDELYPAEQARIMRLVIERIDVAPDGVSVTLHAAGIRSLVAELADQQAPTLAALEPVLEAAE